MKKMLQKWVPVALALVLFAPTGSVGAATAIYSINGTSSVTPTIAGFTVNLSGQAQVTNPQGNAGQYGVSVDWGNGVWVPATFAFTGTTTISTNWSATHLFTTPGNYTITALVHHSTPQGNESGSQKISFTAVIPPENCLNGIDDDFDGFIDLEDTDCLPYFPHITVVKNVINDNKGTKQPGDFSLFVDNTEVTSGQTISVLPGVHTISETAILGYTQVGITGDCAANGSITVAAGIGNNYTCTITNDDDIPAPMLTITKIVNNRGAGTKIVSDFPLFVGLTSVISNIQNIFSAGSYVVSETSSVDYSGVISGDCAGDGSVTLAQGDEKNCTITNTYIDTTGPTVLITPSPQTVEATGPAGASATFTVTATDDVDGDISSSATCNSDSGDTFPLDVITFINCQAIDSSGNTGDGSGTVIVVDTTRPIITLNGSPVVNLNVGDSYSDDGATASDIVDQDLTNAIITGGSVDTSTPGTYTITYDVTDAHGNIAIQVVRTISVSDVSAPIVTVNPPTQTIEATGPAGASANFTVTATDDVDGDISSSVTCDSTSGGTFPLGSTVITCQVTDSSSNTGYGSAIVEVVDTTPPVITLTGGNVTIFAGDTFIDEGAMAFDIVDLDLTTSILVQGTVDTSTPGTYTITYDVTDAHGNIATQITRTVEVQNNLPIITLNGSDTIVLAFGATYTEDGAFADDFEDGSGVPVTDIVGSVNTSIEGTYILTYNFTDSNGGVASPLTRTITVSARPAQCSDGIDNDNDGKTDFPNDPGCISSIDNDEIDPKLPPKRGGGGGRVSGSRGVTPPVGQVLGEAKVICTAVESYMRRGYKNAVEEVKKVQQFLNGYMGWNPPLVIDGQYGPKTEGAVSSFQFLRKENILTPWKITKPTGIFYKTSLAEAKRLMCPDDFGTLPIPTDLVPWGKNTALTPAKAI